MNEITKTAVTVAEMARMCGLGRSRFYQLVGSAFPYPVYDLSTRRPFYTEEMQKACLEVRRRNCGIDGKPILFYAKPVNRVPSAKRRVVPESKHGELVEGLRSLGLNTTPALVRETVKTLFPSGAIGVDSSSMLRAVFIHLQSKEKRP